MSQLWSKEADTGENSAPAGEGSVVGHRVGLPQRALCQPLHNPTDPVHPHPGHSPPRPKAAAQNHMETPLCFEPNFSVSLSVDFANF